MKRLIRWGFVTFVIKKLLKSRASKSAQQAASEFQQSLPPAIGKSVDSLPPRAKAAAGSVIIAGRSAKKVISAATGAQRESVFKSFPQYQKSLRRKQATVSEAEQAQQ